MAAQIDISVEKKIVTLSGTRYPVKERVVAVAPQTEDVGRFCGPDQYQGAVLWF